MNIIFTVCNRNTLASALALGKSVMQFPGNMFYLCWVDKIVISTLPEDINLLTIKDIPIPEWEQMISHYYDFELLPACRPWFAKHLFNLHADQNNFIFFAPTVFLFQPIGQVLTAGPDLFLTPNISQPLKKASVLDDKRILNIGMFHSGSWIMRRSAETLKFLDWWAIRTIDRAKYDLCNGMCLDQLWLNFALVRISKITQISNPGWHYGLHSVLNLNLEYQDGSYKVNGNRLISADFAGLDVFNPIWSDYAGLISESKNFGKLYSEYQKNLSAFQTFLPSETKPGYGLIPEIKKNRMLRKKTTGTLRSVMKFIDQFQIQ